MTVFVPTLDQKVIRQLFARFAISHNSVVYCARGVHGYLCSDKADLYMWCHSQDFAIVESADME